MTLRRLLRIFGVGALLVPASLAMVFVYAVTRDVAVPFDAEWARQVRLSPPTELVPGSRLPPSLRVDESNNNLDVIHFAGRYFLAWRSAPHHFATDAARLLIVSSPDREEWVHEATFDLDRRDLREPRFLELDGRLLFYFFEAEDDPRGFTPISMRAAERRGDGTWTPSRPIFEPGHVVWRAKVRNGVAYMCAYRGDGLYSNLGVAGKPRLLVSEDGYQWRSLSGEASPVDHPGASECDFEFDAAGNLVALVRVEARGALLCTAPAQRLDRWDCELTPYRHDSPLLFRHGDVFYAIARRNLAGPLDTGQSWLWDPIELLWYQLRYWFSRKRTTLYRIVPDEHRSVPVIDFPSRGDTAFAGIVPLEGGRFWVANYSSAINGPDYPWVAGQLTGSRIYSFEIDLPAEHER